MSEKLGYYAEKSFIDSNAMTLATYENRAPEYVERTEQEVPNYVQEWIDCALQGLSTEARILEYGSASGRDAAYIEGKGYHVQRSDATRAFLNILSACGYEARELNVLTDDIGGQHDLILANAVLLHFTRDQVATVIQKTHDALSDDGRFAFTVVEGEGDKWSDGKLGEPRYFCYWQKDQLEHLIRDSGFSSCDFVEGEVDDKGWIRAVCYK